jgi:hypothetical protein
MSQKIKLSQLDKEGISGFVIEVTSGEYYPTGNPSGFVTTGYVTGISGDISGYITSVSGDIHTEIISASGDLATSIATTSGDITGHITSLSGTLDSLEIDLLPVTGSIPSNYDIATGTSGNLDITGVALSGFITGISGDLSGMIAQTGSDLYDDFLGFQATFRDEITGEFLSRAEKSYVQEVSGEVDFKKETKFGHYGLSITGTSVGIVNIGPPAGNENIFFVEHEADTNCYGAIDVLRTKYKFPSGDKPNGQGSPYIDEGLNKIEVILGTFIYSGNY